tara:strand:+ start:53 stop:205 length:153 start_codon:yes stop_codon:yes gene_type:complete
LGRLTISGVEVVSYFFAETILKSLHQGLTIKTLWQARYDVSLLVTMSSLR